jgi:hypothetical protein
VIQVVKLEKISKSVAVKWLPANPVIIDSGAFDGSDSITLAPLSRGTAHAIDTDSQVHDTMQQSTRKNPSVRWQNLTLSDAGGEATFYCEQADLVAPDSQLTLGL